MGYSPDIESLWDRPYTVRYADVLVFSGDREFAVMLHLFLLHAIILNEGFRQVQKNAYPALKRKTASG